jgi:(5-formylfuran-3-yl)methyl phosphate synthase
VQLLVSVRSSPEVGAALAGGADIIDAKEPAHGSLGAVSREVLPHIAAQVPSEVSMSIALGEFGESQEVTSTILSLPLKRRVAPLYLKLGFAGVRSEDRIGSLIAAAVAASNETGAMPRVVAVAYADADRARTVAPMVISDLAARAGGSAVLLDTYSKDGRGLLHWIERPALERWVTETRSAGLMTALAGGLGLDDIERIAAARPDVVGVRGAACETGRQGVVSAVRVRLLRRRLAECCSGSLQGWNTAVGETRDPGRILSG